MPYNISWAVENATFSNVPHWCRESTEGAIINETNMKIFPDTISEAWDKSDIVFDNTPMIEDLDVNIIDTISNAIDDFIDG